jgi:hypothetical protein
VSLPLLLRPNSGHQFFQPRSPAGNGWLIILLLRLVEGFCGRLYDAESALADNTYGDASFIGKGSNSYVYGFDGIDLLYKTTCVSSNP